MEIDALCIDPQNESNVFMGGANGVFNTQTEGRVGLR